MSSINKEGERMKNLIILPMKAVAVILGVLALVLPVFIPIGAIYGLFFH